MSVLMQLIPVGIKVLCLFMDTLLKVKSSHLRKHQTSLKGLCQCYAALWTQSLGSLIKKYQLTSEKESDFVLTIHSVFVFFSRQANFRDETRRRSKVKTGSESFTHDCVHLGVIKPYITVIQYRWKCNLNVNEDAWWSEKGYRLRLRFQLDLAACWSVRRASGFVSRQMAENRRVRFL